MAEGKWIDGLRANMPVVAAARHVLLARLTPVRDHLAPALQHANDDPEHVHQLRVSSRRAGAALRIFADCLPDKVHEKARKSIRAVRRAAGSARDWDVFFELVSRRRASSPERPGLDLLLGIAQGQRMAAQDFLIAKAKLPLDLDEILQATVAAVQAPGAPAANTLRDLAVPLLAEEVKALEQAAGGDLSDYLQLHQVRIQGKRLRYSMEVFACCFAKSFQDVYYPAVEEMQEILGRANDSHVALVRLEAIRAHIKAAMPAKWQRYQSGIEGVMHYHARQLPRVRKQFLTWWRAWRQSGAREAFAGLLKVE